MQLICHLSSQYIGSYPARMLLYYIEKNSRELIDILLECGLIAVCTRMLRYLPRDDEHATIILHSLRMLSTMDSLRHHKNELDMILK